jgi:thiol-disulfide isomerase/thioredoxin
MKHLMLLLIMAILAGCYGSEPQKTGLEGKPLPELSMLLTDSITVLHTRDIPAGKPFVLFYLSPHCPFCRAQTKEIIEDMNKLKDIQFYLITNYPMHDLKGFYKEYQLEKYPNIITGLDTSRAISDYFEISAVPYIAIYGKNKKLNKSFVGKIYSSQIKKAAEE